MLQQKMHGKPFVYLDSAATAQKPKCVIDALHRFYTHEYGTVHRAIYEFAAKATAHYSAVREIVKNFLNASSAEEIIFTKGTTDAINLVAASFGRAFLHEGDEVLISEMEHHSNIVPWQMICKERKAHLKVIPMNDRGELILAEYEILLTPRTKIVSIAHISNVTGTQNPIEEMIALAHKKGAKVMIDGAQSAPHIPVDVRKLDADFFAFSGHKAYGPTGIGVLYGKKELLDRMPPYQGGGDMVDRVSFEETTYQRLPLKFEAGTPMIAEVIGLGEALKYIENVGRNNIAAWDKMLLEYATAKILGIDGLQIYGTAPIKGPVLSFGVAGVHPLDIGSLLDVKGVAIRTGNLCAQPTLKHFGVTSMARASFALYNTREDIDIFVEALRSALAVLK